MASHDNELCTICAYSMRLEHGLIVIRFFIIVVGASAHRKFGEWISSANTAIAPASIKNGHLFTFRRLWIVLRSETLSVQCAHSAHAHSQTRTEHPHILRGIVREILFVIYYDCDYDYDYFSF